jgi:hypothetical protein
VLIARRVLFDVDFPVAWSGGGRFVRR